MKHLLTLLIVLLIPTAALAKGECRDERKKFCAGMVKKQLSDSMRKHEAELGAPCKTKSRLEPQLRKSGELRQAPRQAPTIHHLQRIPSRSQAILTARHSRPGAVPRGVGLAGALFLQYCKDNTARIIAW